jgi:hypothetical protein
MGQECHFPERHPHVEEAPPLFCPNLVLVARRVEINGGVQYHPSYGRAAPRGNDIIGHILVRLGRRGNQIVGLTIAAR